MAEFTTSDPRIAGRARPVGSNCVYVTGGVGIPLYKFAAADTSWCTLAGLGGDTPVTADPRSGGLGRPVGTRVMYVTGGVGTPLLKYGPASTDWCTLASVPQAAVSGLVTSLAATQPLHASLTAVAGVTPGAGGLAVLDDASVAAIRATLELGTAALSSSSAFAPASHSHAAGDLPAVTHRYAAPEVWYKLLVAVSLTNVALDRRASALGTTWPAPRDGSIVGIATKLDGTITAGTITVIPTIAGSNATMTLVHTSASNPTGGTATQAAGVDTYTAGQAIGVVVTTPLTLLPAATLNLEVWLQVTEGP